MKLKDSITIAFDLDDVICYRTSEQGGVEKYNTCKPNLDMVNIVNECYALGYKVVIYTARGMTVFGGDVSKIYSNLYELTLNQLNNWGVKFDQLVMGKIHYDLLVDDKAIRSDRVTNIENIKEVLL